MSDFRFPFSVFRCSLFVFRFPMSDVGGLFFGFSMNKPKSGREKEKNVHFLGLVSVGL